MQFGVTVGQILEFIEHGGHVPRHADLISLRVAGVSPLHGALDVKGDKRVRRDGQDASSRFLTARTVPMTGPPIIDVRVPSAPPVNLIGATLSCRPPNVTYGKSGGTG
jgi:hypothetical protein